LTIRGLSSQRCSAKLARKPSLCGWSPGEPDPSHAGKSRLLREDLDVAEGVEQRDVLSSKIKYGGL